MAKSSLDFIDRINVKTLTEPVVQLSKSDCGRTFVLNELTGHAITLPSADEANPGWHASFVVGAVQNNLVDRPHSSITIPASDTVSIQRLMAAAGAVTNTGVNEVTDALDLTATAAGDGDEEGFTMTVNSAAGGTGTPFLFIIQDAVLPDTKIAGQFVIRRGQADTTTGAHLAARIKELIDGTGTSANVERPETGEGALGAGIQRGNYASKTFTVSVEDTDELRFTFTVPGTAAPAAVLLAERAGSDNNARKEAQANVGAMTPETAGVDQTSVVLNSKVIEIHPSGAAIGDIVDIELVNGIWRATSRQVS